MIPKTSEGKGSLIETLPTNEEVEEMRKLMLCVDSWRKEDGRGLFREDIYGIDIDHALYALCRSVLKEFERDK